MSTLLSTSIKNTSPLNFNSASCKNGFTKLFHNLNDANAEYKNKTLFKKICKSLNDRWFEKNTISINLYGSQSNNIISPPTTASNPLYHQFRSLTIGSRNIKSKSNHDDNHHHSSSKQDYRNIENYDEKVVTQKKYKKAPVPFSLVQQQEKFLQEYTQRKKYGNGSSANNSNNIQMSTTTTTTGRQTRPGSNNNSIKSHSNKAILQKLYNDSLMYSLDVDGKTRFQQGIYNNTSFNCPKEVK